MKNLVRLSILSISLASGNAAVAGITPDTINAASLSKADDLQAPKPSVDPDPAIIRLQVLLDRAGVSPGVIDGIYGDNVLKAVAGFEAMRGLPSDGRLDPTTIDQLEDAGPIIGSYTIARADAEGLVDRIPADYGEKAQMQNMGYTSIAEKLAERFHSDVDLLSALNPGSDFAPGKTISVPMPGPPKEGRVDRIEADKKKGQLAAFDQDGGLLAIYPATVGSDDNPSPKGTHKVKGVARMPVYRYDPKVNFKQGKNADVLTIPKGPNGPVGSVWIDLTEPTYGIHGTPDPELIGKIGSHGCVRLTNWDAEELAGMVKPGVTVKFIN